jgi:hypothetical protein
MKMTVWVRGSSQSMEQHAEEFERGDWEQLLDDLQMGAFSPDYVMLWDEDHNTSHYVRTTAIDVIKVEW